MVFFLASTTSAALSHWSAQLLKLSASTGRVNVNTSGPCAGSVGAEMGWRAILNAGANDFGGISPVTRDYVNPEKPWPHLHALASATAAAGKALVPRCAPTSHPLVICTPCTHPSASSSRLALQRSPVASSVVLLPRAFVHYMGLPA